MSVLLLACLLALVPEKPRGDRAVNRRELTATAGFGARLLLAAAFVTGASSFVYEHRSSDPAPKPIFPHPALKTRWREIQQISVKMGIAEE